MRTSFRAAALTAALLFLPKPVLAEDVTLKARSGALSVSGSLLSYDGESYRVKTAFGELSVEAEAVDCDGPGCPHLGGFTAEIRISLEPWVASTVLIPRLQDYAAAEGLELIPPSKGGDAFQLRRANHTEVRLQLAPPSPKGWQTDLTEGRADVAITAEALLKDLPLGQARLLAHLPLTLVTGTQAHGLSDPQLRQPQALWGPDQPVIWHQLKDAPSLQQTEAALLGPLLGQSPKTAPDFDALRRAIAADPWAIALLPADQAQDLPQPSLTQACGFQRDASPFALASGDDAMRLALHWVEAGPRLPAHGRRLAAYLTRQAQGAPLAQAPQSLQQGTARLFNTLMDPNPDALPEARREALALLQNARRLPHTLRTMADGGLDQPSQYALEDLATRLATLDYAGLEILLIGFSGAENPREVSQATSLRMAQYVQHRLSEALGLSDTAPQDGPSLRALGLGEVMPLRCLEEAGAHSFNTRVEVWLKPKDSPLRGN